MISRPFIAAILAIGLASPAIAQQRSAADQQVENVIEKFFRAFNTGDPNATAALWAADPVDINVNGMVSGKQKMDERIQAELKMGLKLEHKIDQVHVNGAIAWAVGSYTVTIPGQNGTSVQSPGNWLQVLEQDGGGWKIRAASFTRQNPPAAATGSSAAPAKSQ